MFGKLLKLIFITIGIISSAILIISSADTVIAHGDMNQIHRSNINNYDISVSILPHDPIVGGFSHFTVEPRERKSLAPIEEALITLVIRKGEYAYKSRAVNSPNSPELYDANFTFKEGGTWDVEIQIATIPEEFTSIHFPLSVSGESVKEGREAGLFFLFVFFFLIIGSITLTLKYRKKNN